MTLATTAPTGAHELSLRRSAVAAALTLFDEGNTLPFIARYCARPPFALHRLHAIGGNDVLASADARLVYRRPGPTPDGRTVLLLSPLELLQRLARLVPPPREA